MKNISGKISDMPVERPVFEMDEMNEAYQYDKNSVSCAAKCKETCKLMISKPRVTKLVPFFDWFPNYRWKEWFIGDIVAGLTLSVLQLPQAMACGVLAEVPPVNGIYTGIFPVVVYVIFGSSKHVSIGTFAAVALMTGAVVSEHTTIVTQANLTRIQIDPKNSKQYTDVEVAQTLAFTVALIEICMYILRLGVLSQVLSDTFLTAFTCGISYHVANSQIRDLIELPTQKRRGNFAIPLTVYDFSMKCTQANYVAVAISFASCTLLLLNNYLLKKWLSKRTLIPFPAELIIVILITSLSKLMNFNKIYNIPIVGCVPTGFPKMTAPKLQLIPAILLDSFVITIVCFSVTISLALIFARKCNYEVDSNQELLALGLSNIFGSFSLCMPVSGSLSRTMLRYNAGGKTQLASFVSSSILVLVILWMGPLFEPLPRCVLASIIIVALMEMLLKLRTLPKYWRLSRWDFAVWVTTFLVTFVVQISYGLVVGVIVSLVTICIQGYTPYTSILGIVPNTDLYLDVKRYKVVREIDGIKILNYCGSINFASVGCFRKQLFRKTGFDPAEIYRKRERNYKKGLVDEEFNINIVILNFSNVTFTDPAGVNCLRMLRDDYQKIDVVMLISGCSDAVFETILKCDKIEKKQKKFLIFPTVHDAVLYAQVNLLSKNK